MNKMSLELLIGPMFAGKSSAIHSIVRRHIALGWSVCTITHTIDNRYSETPAIVNHDLISLPAVATDRLMTVKESLRFTQSRLVVIEEAQFFEDLVPFVLMAVEEMGKNVVVVGLDGDAMRRPFGHILELIPYADRVQKLYALCNICCDGTPALFTYAHNPRVGEGPCVGAADKYSPLCRKHYLRKFERRVSIDATHLSLLG